MNWVHLKDWGYEWVYNSKIFRVRYREFQAGRWIVNVGMWPLSWSIGLLWASDGELTVGLGPFGLHVY